MRVTAWLNASNMEASEAKTAYVDTKCMAKYAICLAKSDVKREDSPQNLEMVMVFHIAN